MEKKLSKATIEQIEDCLFKKKTMCELKIEHGRVVVVEIRRKAIRTVETV